MIDVHQRIVDAIHQQGKALEQTALVGLGLIALKEYNSPDHGIVASEEIVAVRRTDSGDFIVMAPNGNIYFQQRANLMLWLDKQFTNAQVAQPVPVVAPPVKTSPVLTAPAAKQASASLLGELESVLDQASGVTVAPTPIPMHARASHSNMQAVTAVQTPQNAAPVAPPKPPEPPKLEVETYLYNELVCDRDGCGSDQLSVTLPNIPGTTVQGSYVCRACGHTEKWMVKADQAEDIRTKGQRQGAVVQQKAPETFVSTAPVTPPAGKRGRSKKSAAPASEDPKQQQITFSGAANSATTNSQPNTAQNMIGNSVTPNGVSPNALEESLKNTQEAAAKILEGIEMPVDKEAAKQEMKESLIIQPTAKLIEQFEKATGQKWVGLPDPEKLSDALAEVLVGRAIGDDEFEQLLAGSFSPTPGGN